MEGTNGPKALAGASNATVGETAKLADEVAKADPWAMIHKIKEAKAKTAAVGAGADVGALAVGSGNASVTAKSNADLAAAVALKAMTKNGKFSVQPTDDAAVKAAAANAVNKVLGILDFIIRKTIAINLEKVRKAVEGVRCSETTEASTVKN